MFLLSSSVTPGVLDGYRRLVTAFLMFCGFLSLPLGSRVEIDRAFCVYADEQFCDGCGASTGERLLSAFCALYPEHSPGDFPFYLRALRGWRRLKPKYSRHPLPWPVLCAAAYYVRTRTPGDFEGMMALMLIFDAYLRPYEALWLRVKDFVRPVGNAWWCLVICPREAMRPSKTNTFDDSVLIDSTWRPQVAALLPQLLHRAERRGCCGQDFIFPFTQEQLGKWFKEAIAWLHLEAWGFTLYSARHGAPSEDFLQEQRSLEVIKRRGRWAADASTRRYQQHGRLQVVYSGMAPGVLRACMQTEAHLLALLQEGAPSLRRPEPETTVVPASAPLPEEED